LIWQGSGGRFAEVKEEFWLEVRKFKIHSQKLIKDIEKQPLQMK
jgi:cytochrome c556